MGRVEDNKKTMLVIKDVIKEAEYIGEDASNGVIASCLIDISKSLAVIADALTKEGDEK